MNDEAETVQPTVDHLMQEYAVIVAKMSANESWAYSFVALYFAFLASLAAATGYLVFGETAASLQGPAFAVLGVDVTLVRSLCILGLALNGWAIFMVFDYKFVTGRLVTRLKFIEAQVGLSASGPPSIGASAAHNATSTWRFGQMGLVGSVMLLFFVPWLVIISSN